MVPNSKYNRYHWLLMDHHGLINGSVVLMERIALNTALFFLANLLESAAEALHEAFGCRCEQSLVLPEKKYHSMSF